MKRLLMYILPAVLAVPVVVIGRNLLNPPRRSARRVSGNRGRERTQVFITDYGTKYHTADCRALLHSKTAHKVPLDEVADQYEACSECHPPELQTATDRRN